MQPAGAEGFFDEAGVWLDGDGARAAAAPSTDAVLEAAAGTASSSCPARASAAAPL